MAPSAENDRLSSDPPGRGLHRPGAASMPVDSVRYVIAEFRRPELVTGSRPVWDPEPPEDGELGALDDERLPWGGGRKPGDNETTPTHEFRLRAPGDG